MWWNYRRTISAWNLSDHHHHHWCSADNRHNGGVKIQDICNNILQILGFTRLKRLQLNRSIFCWHSCPQLLSSPVFIRWSNIKWYFCCLSWGIFKKLATDPLQMQHRGNETNIKMLVYFQEFNLKKLRRLKNNVDMLNRNRYITPPLKKVQELKNFIQLLTLISGIIYQADQELGGSLKWSMANFCPGAKTAGEIG